LEIFQGDLANTFDSESAQARLVAPLSQRDSGFPKIPIFVHEFIFPETLRNSKLFTRRFCES